MKENKFEPYGHTDPKLVIYIADKTSPRGEALLAWNLMRLKLTQAEVQVRYESNWQAAREGRTLLILGKEVCRNTIKAKFANYLYSSIPGLPIFFGHSIDYALMNPAETYRINRVLYVAAIEAGLNPITDLQLPAYKNYAQF